MSDSENQEDEFCVLQSIYTEEEFQREEGAKSGKFQAFPVLPSGFSLIYKSFADGGKEAVRVPIEYLSPITLTFKLPENYPSVSMPDFTVSCCWLSITKMNRICSKLDELWEANKGSVILYIWTQFLKEDVLSFVGIVNELDISSKHVSELRRFGVMPKKISDERKRRALIRKQRGQVIVKDSRIIALSNTNMLTLEYLEAFNEDRSNAMFLKNIYSCGICFADKFGSMSVKFSPCGHIYCKQCVGTYFETRIKDGMIQSMPCPFDKCKSEARHNQIKEVLGNQLFSKYDTLLLNATLNSMADITYCPRISCGSPVIRENDDLMAACPTCKFVFCILCKMTYHGVAPCRLKLEDKQKLIEEYDAGDDQTRLRLEKRYGKKRMLNLVQEVQSESWIECNSKPCPKCRTAIEKSLGCNKITCWKCQTNFCWLCLGVLDPKLPYGHYSDLGSNCAQMLFYGTEIPTEDDDDEEEEYDLLFEISDEEEEEDFYYLL